MFQVESESTASIDIPDIGWCEIWYDDSDKSWKYKASDNVVRTFAVGVTREFVEDLLANSFENTSNIVWTYDDTANKFRANLSTSFLNTVNSKASQTALDNHVGSTSNPHSVTKSQVGLSNVPNTNATLRSNHTGTQLAATISDLKQFIDNYLDRYVNQNTSISVNTSTSWAIRWSETFTPKNTAQYIVSVTFGYSHDNTGSNIETELLVDGSVVDDMEKEFQDAGGTEGASGTDQKEKTVLKYLVPMTSGTDVDLSFEYRTESNGVEASIKGHIVEIQRYMP